MSLPRGAKATASGQSWKILRTPFRMFDWRSVMAIGDWAAVAAVLVAGAAIATSLRSVRDQLRISTFLAYTERYSEVMARLPFEARRPGSGYSLARVNEDERETVLSAFRDYFNLCSEELWLHRSRWIDKRTWDIWHSGMRRVFCFPCS